MMVDPNTITGLLITQSVLLIVAIVGGFFKLNYDRKLLQSQTAAKIKEIEHNIIKQTELEFIEEQLSAFYGPIQMLLRTNESLFKKSFDTDVWESVRKNILLPNNNKIAEIIVNKIHLLEGNEIPPSFIRFIEHAYLWDAYKDVESGFSQAYFKKNATFPRKFASDIDIGFKVVRQKYHNAINSNQRNSI
jgi:hypothetical protein